MKKTFQVLLVLMVLLFGTAQAQKFTPPQMKTANESESVINTYGLSATSAMLATDLVMGKTHEQIKAKYPVVNLFGEDYIQAFVDMNEGQSLSSLAEYGVKVNTDMKTTATVMIPLDNFLLLAQSQLCRYLDVTRKVNKLLESARSTTNVNQAYAGTGLAQGYDGTGVIVGVVDDGFEYAHPTFYDTTGTELRVKRVWDQSTNSGSHPSGYTYGVEYTTADDIIEAGYGSDEESHATHVAGIAAGSGYSTTYNRKYRGMAPNADIVMVQSTLTDASIVDGINYIANYAQSVGKPCVINLSLGGQIGPHDGTSSFDRQMTSLTNEHPNGLILVGACGNGGSDSLHVSHTFSETDTAMYTIVNPTYTSGYYSSASYGYVDLWGAANQDYQVGFAIYNTSTGQYTATGNMYNVASGTYNVSLDGEDAELQAQITCVTDANNNKRNAFLYISFESSSSWWGSSSDDEVLMLVVKSSTPGTVHGWGEYAEFTNANISGITNGDSRYSVAEIGGIGEEMISVGSYMSQDSVLNASNQYYTCDEGVEGGLSYFSSYGPTADGRVKPDIAGPGQMVVSAFNRGDMYMTEYSSYYYGYDYTVASENFSGNTEYWGMMQGTSMASPAVTGIVALWLQKNPNLTIAQAKQMMKESPITDQYTGTIPSTGDYHWGWGKINALAGLMDRTEGIDGAEISYLLTNHNGCLGIEGADGQQLVIMDVMGRVIVNEKIVSGRTYRMPATGVYMVRVGGSAARKAVVTL